MNLQSDTAAEHPHLKVSQRISVVTCALLIAFPWFWPILVPPRPEFWPDMVAWSVGAVLISLLPWTRERAGLSMAVGWLLAALGNAVLALLQYLDLEDRFYPWIVATRPGITQGNVHQINMLATLLAVGLLSLWWLSINRYLKPRNTTWMAGLLLAALAATASRTGMVHLVAIAFLLLYWHWPERAKTGRVLLAGFSVYLLVAWMLPWLGSVVSGTEIQRELMNRFGSADYCHSRRVLWRNVIDLIAIKPWAGWGPGGLLYAHYITPFDGIRYCEKMSNAHNLPLQMAVTLGLPLTLLICAFFAYAVFKLKPWSAKQSMEKLSWGVLLLLGLHSLLEYPLWFGVFQLMAGLAVWQIFVIRRFEAQAPGAALGVLTSSAGLGAMSMLLLAFLSFVAWDYLKVSQLYISDSQRMERYRVDTFEKASTTLLFQSHVLIPQVVTTKLTPANASLILDGALASLHVAPDSRVIRRVIESAGMLGRQDLVELHTARYKAAWPKEFAEWQALKSPQNGRSSPPASPSSASR